jgi:hypothetical protein
VFYRYPDAVLPDDAHQTPRECSPSVNLGLPTFADAHIQRTCKTERGHVPTLPLKAVCIHSLGLKWQ